MIVCHCYHVSDGDVLAACATSGGKSRAVVRSTHAGTGCGGCLSHLREVIESYDPQMVHDIPADAMEELAAEVA
jgi:NAD(P)H-nitrite reductase large subunit